MIKQTKVCRLYPVSTNAFEFSFKAMKSTNLGFLILNAEAQFEDYLREIPRRFSRPINLSWNIERDQSLVLTAKNADHEQVIAMIMTKEHTDNDK